MMSLAMQPEIRRFRKRMIVACAILFGGFSILLILATTFPSSDEIRVGAIVAWLGASVLALRRVGSFNCPGCGQRFRTDWYIASIWPTKTCRNCGYSLRGKL